MNGCRAGFFACFGPPCIFSIHTQGLRNMEQLSVYDFEGYLKKDNIKHVKTGSRYVCNPSVRNTDADFVLVDSLENRQLLKNLCFRSSKKRCKYNVEENGSIVEAFRNSAINVILTRDEETLAAWSVASKVAALLNLKEKNERIALFKALLY